jgi:hypothetical protein
LASNNSAVTPDLKKSYIADVNSIYLASIKANSSNNQQQQQQQHDSFYSPVKSSFTFNYSASSSSNSPVLQQTRSPARFDTFIKQRDNFNSKLLKSPAAFSPRFSPYASNNSNHCPGTIRSFSSRLNTQSSSTSAVNITKPTPTEEEFMQMLIADQHLPSNPDSLIGRHMGLEKLDIVNELWKRSMNNVLELVFANMDTDDLVRVGCVSRDWRAILKENGPLYRKRRDYIRKRKALCENFKENRRGGSSSISHQETVFDYEMAQHDTAAGQAAALLSLEEKRMLFKKYRAKVSLDLSRRGLDTVFTSLDVNCLNNLTKSPPPPPQQPQPASRSALGENFLQAASSLTLKPGNSVAGEFECASNTKKRIDSLPKFICRNFKLSPAKSSPVKSATASESVMASISTATTMTTSKIDLIGSRKSKKNLKRL